MVRASTPGAVLACLLLCCSVLAAQVAPADRSIGTVARLDGGQMTVVRGGTLRWLDPGPEANGYPLHSGDQVSTEPGVLLTVSLPAADLVVYAAENTTVVFSGVDSIEIVYGRIRLVSGPVGPAAFSVLGTVVAAAGGSVDFAFEHELSRSGAHYRTRVYAMAGAVTVTAPESGIVLEAGRMVEFVSAGPVDPPASLTAVAALPDAPAFWGQAGFAVQDPEPERPTPVAETPLPAVSGPVVRAVERPAPSVESEPERPSAEERRSAFARSSRTAGGVLTGAGLATGAASLVLGLFGDALVPGWSDASSSLLTPIAVSGGALAAAGFVAFVLSALTSP